MIKYLELVEGSFTQEHFDKQEGQIPYVAYSIQDDKVIYNIVPTEDGTMYTIYRIVSKDISNCTYNMVDLGLSVKWADRNVGASSSEDYGSYFQWGATDAYTFDGVGEITADKLAEMMNPLLGPALGIEITSDNVGMVLEQSGITGTDLTNTPAGAFIYSLDKSFDFNSYFDTTDGGSTFNKYNSNGGLTVLEPVDDAATIHMGSQYRMPTDIEIQELINNTNQTFIDLEGNEYSKEQAENGAIEPRKLKGARFIGSNSNSIFIPAAGNCWEYVISGNDSRGYVWSSSLYDDINNNNFAIGFVFDNDGSVNGSNIRRGTGKSVRGVRA